MKKYSNMSDFDVNKAVHILKGFTADDYVADYCNAVSEWAQLLIDSKLSLSWNPANSECVAYFYHKPSGYKQVFDLKPGRAVAICFLMKKELEDE